MLTIKTTPHLYGISLQGDYQDLNAIYDSLSRYLDFYQINMPSWPYHEYEYMLSLNYDIRHAYMGTREIERVENNASEVGVIAEAFYQLPKEAKKDFRNIRKDFSAGNLYFSVNILYPLVFHYLIVLDSILDDYLLPSAHTEQSKYQSLYSPLQANLDMAQIRLLTALLWDNLKDLFGEKTANLLYNYYSEHEYYIPTPALYIDALLHFQMLHFDHLPDEEQKALLLVSLFEIIDSESLSETPEEFEEENAIFQASVRLLEDRGLAFPTQNAFFDALEKAIPKGQPLYENIFDQFLNEQYGVIENEEEEPDW